MKEPYTIATIDEEFYSLHFTLFSKEFEDLIHFYAECSKNQDCHGADDYYYLELFFSVGDYGTRDFLIGLCFGHAAMDKEMLDREIRSYLNAELDDTFPELVTRFLKKEHLMEDWLSEQEGN